MKTSLISPKELDESHIELWRSWQCADPRLSSSFLCPEFAIAYGRHKDSARVAIIEQDHEVIGFFPFERSYLQVGRSLAYGLADVQAIIPKPGAVLDRTLLLAQCGLAVLEFEYLVPHQIEVFEPHKHEFVRNPVIDLSAGWESWIAEKRKYSKSRFRRILQKQRQLAREVGAIDFEFKSSSHADLDKLMAWKSAQYVRTGRQDRFGKPWFRSFMHDLLDCSGEHFGVALSRLDAGGQTVAMDLGLHSGNTFSGWFPAYDVNFNSYSVGNVCALMQVEAAANSGLSRMDLGPGEAAYKESFKNFDGQVATGWCERPVAAAVIRRVQLAPKRFAMKVVLNNPTLRKSARAALNNVGTLRAILRQPRSAR